MIKKLGLQHGIPLMIISWFFYYFYGPYWGIGSSIYMAGRFEGREEFHAEIRGFKPFKPSTWRFDQFEWPDFLTSWVLAGSNVYLMKGDL